MSDERRELLDLIVRHSFERRKVVLSSGRASDFYLDLRTTMMRPRGIELAGNLLFARLEQGAHVLGPGRGQGPEREHGLAGPEQLVLGGGGSEHRGKHLRATNVGRGRLRPRWRITQSALDEFLAARTPSRPIKPASPSGGSTTSTDDAE